jgi:hypothetical protein
MNQESFQAYHSQDSIRPQRAFYWLSMGQLVTWALGMPAFCRQLYAI